MTSKIIIFFAIALIATSVEGFRGFGAFSGFPFNGGDPMSFVMQNVPQAFPSNWVQNSFPVIPPVKIPSKDEILHFKPRPGQNYQGMVMTSNGGESQLIVNNNGEVFSHKFPNSVDEPETNEPMDLLKPIDPLSLRNFVASPNTQGQAHVVMSSSSYVNNNGKESSSGGLYSMVNDGKTVKETSYTY